MPTLVKCANCGNEQSIDWDQVQTHEDGVSLCTNCKLPMAQMESKARPKAEMDAPSGQGDSLIDIVKAHLSSNDVELTTIPVVAQQVLASAQDPDCTLVDLEGLIRKDQVVASKIVQVANSSFYRGLKEVHALPDAIMRLGFKGVQNITVAVAVKNTYQCKNKKYLEILERLWTHSVHSAITCREIAVAARFGKEEEAFLAGLVHDIGRVFIINALDKMAETDERINSLPEEIFQELLMVLHESTGARLIESWMFPQAICEAVRHHHNPAAVEEGKLVWILAAADMVMHKVGLGGYEADEGMSLNNLPSMQALQLNDLEIAKLLVDLEDKAQELLGSLEGR
jgi:HD-like signal output (HDOD) protein